jgi:hypothetical protein
MSASVGCFTAIVTIASPASVCGQRCCSIASAPLPRCIRRYELIFAGIFGYRGLSGFACRHAIERPLYLMLSLFTIIYELRFISGLWFDTDIRALYLQGKGGLINHDLVLVARDYLHVDLTVVLGLLTFATLATPLITLVLYRYRQWMGYSLARLFSAR